MGCRENGLDLKLSRLTYMCKFEGMLTFVDNHVFMVLTTKAQWRQSNTDDSKTMRTIIALTNKPVRKKRKRVSIVHAAGWDNKGTYRSAAMSDRFTALYFML